MVSKIKLKMGLERVSKPKFASEPGMVAQVQAQVRALQDDLEYIFDQFEDVTPEICLEALKPVFEQSKVYCPKLTGDLVNSGYLEVVGYRGKPRVEMGYGKGGRPYYAAYVHEMTQIHHAYPTQAKFLERAVNEDIGGIIDRVSDGYKRFMGV